MFMDEPGKEYRVNRNLLIFEFWCTGICMKMGANSIKTRRDIHDIILFILLKTMPFLIFLRTNGQKRKWTKTIIRRCLFLQFNSCRCPNSYYNQLTFAFNISRFPCSVFCALFSFGCHAKGDLMSLDTGVCHLILVQIGRISARWGSGTEGEGVFRRGRTYDSW